MKSYKVKTKVKENFNDSKNGNKPYEANDPIILERGRYEELYAAGYVEKGEVLKEQKEEKKKNENQD